jgi:crotonobetainyl-CoA:carnitine CoA-transferase CaiB-like acyl-CoA transferase
VTSSNLRPLSGLRVLDLSRVLAGPFCTMNLGDLGAEIIKIEEVHKGDDTRAFGPPFVHGESTYFLSINRNKKSVAVNLKAKEGVALVQRLAAGCDVVVENFRPGVAQRLGLGAAALRAQHPRLIYCSISGYGHAGLKDYVEKPGYDAVMQGEAGLQHLTGEAEGPPSRVGVSISDLLSGLTAFQAILAALYAREKTGQGDTLDIAMLDATAQVLTFHAAGALNAGTQPKRQGNRHASIAPYETFQGEDGVWFNLAVGNDAQWKDFCRAAGLEGLTDDARFATNPDRARNKLELSGLIAQRLATRPAAHWLALLDAEGIPCGVIAPVHEVVAHPQLLARGKVWTVQHPKAGALKFLGNPLPQADSSAAAPPLLGQHTGEVLARLGVDGEEQRRLEAAGVVKLGA